MQFLTNIMSQKPIVKIQPQAYLQQYLLFVSKVLSDLSLVINLKSSNPNTNRQTNYNYHLTNEKKPEDIEKIN